MKAYVIHSATADVSSIRKLLIQNDVSYQDSFDLSAGVEITTAIRSVIRSSDAVIAVISENAANVFFELGIAVALRKPILALLHPRMNQASFLLPTTLLISDLSDSEVLKIAVENFLRKSRSRLLKGVSHEMKISERRRSFSERGVSTPKEKKSPANVFLDADVMHLLSQNQQALRGFELEQKVAEMLLSAGVTTIEQQSTARDQGVDIAVWSDPLRNSIGSPILIEIKSSVQNAAAFETAYRSLAKKVRESESAAGILLYLAGQGQRFERPATWVPGVLWFEITDFAKALSEKSFADTLLERRNNIIHGTGV